MEFFPPLGNILGALVAIAAGLFSLFMWLWMLWHVIRAIVRIIISLPAAMFRLYLFLKEYPSVITIVVTNALPLAGVLWFNWSLFSVLFLYWIQSVVVGYFSTFKLKKVAEVDPTPQHIQVIAFTVRRFHTARSPENIIRDFIKVYRFGIIVSLVLIILLVGLQETQGLNSTFFHKTFTAVIREFTESFWGIIAGSLSFFFNHGFSYLSNFLGKREYLRSTLKQQLEMPMERVGLIWAATFLTSIWAVAIPLGQLLTALTIILILLKSFLDVYAHIRERTSKEPLREWLRGYTRSHTWTPQ